MNSECPDQQSLQLLLLGKLSGPELATLEAHLSQCSRCAKAAETIVVEDDLTAAIRSAPEISAEDSALAAAIAASKLLVKGEGTGSMGDTRSVAFDESHSRADLSWNESVQCADLDLSFLQPAESDDELGRLGSYRILDVLGVGGMGIVFRAEDVQLQREVALKAMKPAVAANTTAKDRFLHEARSAAAIDHEHIVHIYQVGEDRGVPFIAMQFLRGETLRTRLEREGSLDQDMVIRIGREVAAGLSAAHERGMIHRDIKPDNIWLQTTGSDSATDFRVKLLDFGLVRSLDDDPNLTTTGVLLGTPRYMSPEQAQGEDVDARSDLFSLGSMLYHAVTGTAPFAGTNVASTLIAVVSKQPPPIAEVAPRTDRRLASAIESMLAKKRDNRPATAAEISSTLATIAEERLQQASQPTTETAPIRGSRRRWLPWLIGGASAALLMIACGLTFLMRTPEGTLRIEVDDPHLTVLVDGDEVKLTDKKWHGKRAADKHRLALKLGEQQIPIDSPSKFTLSDGNIEYLLKVNRNGVALRSELFEVTRGAETVLTISLTRVSEANAAEDAAPEQSDIAIAPFDADEAVAYQQKFAKGLGVPVEFTNELGMKFRLIPAGKFEMGSSNGDPNEHPPHEVTISQPYYLGVYETIQHEYEAVVPDNPSRFEGERLPVEFVTSEEAIAYCKALSDETGLTHRLPTEAEWEFACRAGTTSAWHFGDDPNDLPEYAWTKENGEEKTHPVGEKKPNPFGLYDMHGNVFEYCSDFTAFYSAEPQTDPQGPKLGRYRGFRGGSWFFPLYHSRSANRQDKQWPARGTHVGFRVLLEVDDVMQRLDNSKPSMTAADRLVAGLTPTLVEEFDTDELFPASENDPERQITGGRQVMTWPADSNKRGIWVWSRELCDDGIVDVSGRIVAGRRADGPFTRWMVMLHKTNHNGPGLLVRVADDRVSTEKSIYDKRFDGDPNRKQFMIEQSELDTDFHRLQLLVEGSKRRVTIFHDGIQVGEPITLDDDFTPARFYLGMEHQDRDQAGVVEVERYAFYPLPEDR